METFYKTPLLKDAELLAVFPEAKQSIPQKIKELETKRKNVEQVIKKRLAVINKVTDEFSRWFWRKWLKLTVGEELLAINKNLARLRRQNNLLEGKKQPKNAITDDLIQSARNVSIESLLNQPLRRRGSNLTCHCPFHEERTPSFHIYPQENRGWCFGCNQGGDAISVTMLQHDCNFKDAVLMLTGGQE